MCYCEPVKSIGGLGRIIPDSLESGVTIILVLEPTTHGKHAQGLWSRSKRQSRKGLLPPFLVSGLTTLTVTKIGLSRLGSSRRLLPLPMSLALPWTLP